MTTHQRVVGLVGLGQMGGSMCRTLLREGWQVVAWDPAGPAMEAASRSGAVPASDPSDVASRTDIVIISVPDAQAVRLAVLGERGLVRASRTETLIVDTSTMLAAEARTLATDLATYGVGFLDAPVSGGVRGAETGQLAVMVGGSVTDFERAHPVLACLGKAVVHCGPVGAGQITKACNQLVVMATHASIAEALVLAQASGLDPWRVREVLMAGYGASPILEIQGPRMLTRDFAPGGRARFHLKDIVAIGELATDANLELPVFEAAARQFERLVEAGGGDLDNSAVITMIGPSVSQPEAVRTEDG